MIRIPALALVLLAVPAFSQPADEAPAPSDTAAQSDASPADAAAPPKKRRKPKAAATESLPLPAEQPPVELPAAIAHGEVTGEEAQALLIARTFFAALLAGEARTAVDQSAIPFTLEDRRINSEDDLLQAWIKSLRKKRTELLTLYGIELLSPAQMEQKYGRPPPRLASFPWRSSRALIAVANLSGRAAVAVLVPLGERGYAVVAYHD